ncbi:MMS19 nucleotide excision repair -like protein [Halotydeus destructor]|nr:MMS19 nucleotide excision repair -like protein [Halotydeus destructor]
MSDNTELLVLIGSVINSEEDGECIKRFCKYVDGNRPSFLAIMEAFGPSLLSPDLKVRTKCFDTLADLFRNLDLSAITSDEVNHIVQFLSKRMESEFDAVGSILDLLMVMCHRFASSSEFTTTTFTALTKNLYVPQFPVNVRYTAYQIIAHLIEVNLDALTSLNYDFVSGFIQVIEGERDPRCLLLTFNLFHLVMRDRPLGHYDEDAFDVVSCYFPITYVQPTNDPYNISRQELAKTLHRCLSSSASFAPYAIPLFLEKATSDMKDAKIDSYQALAMSLPIYGLQNVTPYLGTIWASVRVETLKPDITDSELFSAALQVLAALSKTIEMNDEMLIKFLNEVTYDLEAAIVKPELELRDAALDILIACCTSCRSFGLVSEKNLALLLERLANESENQSEILQNIRKFLNLTDLYDSTTLHHKDAIVRSCLNVLEMQDSKVQHAALKCLSCLIDSGIIFGEDVQKLKENLAILLNSGDGMVFEFFVSLQNSGKTEEEMPRKLLDILSSSVVGSNQHGNALEVLSHLKLSEDVQSKIVQHFIELANKKDMNNLSQSSLDFLTKLVNCLSSSNDFLYKECLWPLLSGHLHPRILAANDWKPDDTDSDELLFTIISVIASALNKDNATETVNLLAESYFLGKVEKQITDVKPGKNSNSSITIVNKRVVELLSKVSDAILSHVIPEAMNEQALQLVSHIIRAGGMHHALCNAICALSNKADGSVLAEFIDLVEDEFDRLPSSRTLHLIIWTLKGLMMRSHERANALIERLQSSLTKENLRTVAAKGFEVIHETSSMSHETEMVFYRQKFFNQTVNFLLKSLNDTSLDLATRQVYRSAIICQLKYLPKAVLNAEAKRLHNIAIASLDDEGESRSVAVKCIRHLLEENSTVFASSLHSLIDNLLKSLVPGNSSLDVKRGALSCLTLIAKLFPERHLLIERTEVISRLKILLDDKKRLVRMAAADARLKWLLIGQPGNDQTEAS